MEENQKKIEEQNRKMVKLYLISGQVTPMSMRKYCRPRRDLK